MKKSISALLMMVAFGVMSPTTQAASQNECAIWLCLPAGFPSGCGAAHSAMMKRIKKLKPPLPAFSACAVSGGSNMTYKLSNAAYVPQRTVCADEFPDPEAGCISTKVIPEHYVKDAYCDHGEGSSSGPTGCSRNYRYIDIFIEGKLAGETYYW